jgi:serine/threonine-protein kinase
MIGTKLAHYEITNHLGTGGMGEVYQATDTKLGRSVAIKLLPAAFAMDADRLSRFRREAQVLASLNHPNIAHVYGIEESGDTRCIVMELVHGETLQERIKKGPIPVDDTLAIAKQIAEALEAAHDKGVIHRDLKPGNIMLTNDGRVKVLDFGLAKAYETNPSNPTMSNSPTIASIAATNAGVILGTAAYMSPEQARGRNVDRRADIWAFGVVLYEMLTGRQLFQGDELADTLAQVLTSEPEWQLVPVNMRRLLKSCLQKDPLRRLHDIRDAWQLLDEDAPPQAAVTPAVKTRLPWAVAAVLAVALVGVSWIAWLATRPAAHPLMNLSVDMGPDAAFDDSQRIAFILSPDGARLVFASKAGGKRQLSVRQLAQTSATLLAGTENATDPFFSPDGQWIGFFAGGNLKKIPVTGGSAITLCETGGERGGTWGEDHNIIFGTTRSGLLRVSDAGGTPQPLTQLDTQSGESTHRFPQILPGGSAVLFTASSTNVNFNNATIEVLSLKTMKRKTLQRGGFFGRYVAVSGSSYLLFVRNNMLFATPMDLGTLDLTGPEETILGSVVNFQGAAHFDVSSTGALVYVSGKSSSAEWRIGWLDATGKTQPLKAQGQYYTPRFSPDGMRLALTVVGETNDVWSYDWQRDQPSRLSFTPGVNNHPVWTPDGKGIVYRSASGNDFRLYWIRSDGSSSAVLLKESKKDMTPHSFSPDGKYLVFTEQGGAESGADILTLSIDWTDPEHPKAGPTAAFLRTPVLEYNAMFSPDGRWIAYGSSEGPTPEIYVRPFPANPSGGKWQISSGGGNYPIWSQNGRELFYQGSDAIMVVGYAVKGSTFVPDKPHVWSDRPLFRPIGTAESSYDLDPNGKRFAVFESTEAAQKADTHVNLLLNFGEELRRRVPLVK